MAKTGRYREVNQYRSDPPTAYENALGDVLESAFADGLHHLPDIIRRLNKSNIIIAEGCEWTEQLFTAEMKRLADL